jgi:hypothetical protein
MKCVDVALAIASLIIGLVAAWYWYKASIIKTEPGEAVNSGAISVQDRAWIVALMDASNKAARLNKIASILTALSVVIGAASSVLGALG